ncbi:unnamed protein product [Caenorhabditis brenneri]
MPRFLLLICLFGIFGHVACPNNPSDVFNKIDDDTQKIPLKNAEKPKEQRLDNFLSLSVPDIDNVMPASVWLGLFLVNLFVAFATYLVVLRVNRNPLEPEMPPNQQDPRLHIPMGGIWRAGRGIPVGPVVEEEPHDPAEQLEVPDAPEVEAPEPLDLNAPEDILVEIWI